MTDISIPVYSDQDLSPRAMDVIRAVVDDAYPEHKITFNGWTGNRMQKVLVLGRAPDGGWENVEFVYTYSIAQIMSKANAASVLASALRQFIETPDPIEFNSTPVLWRGYDISNHTHRTRLLSPSCGPPCAVPAH